MSLEIVKVLQFFEEKNVPKEEISKAFMEVLKHPAVFINVNSFFDALLKIVVKNNPALRKMSEQLNLDPNLSAEERLINALEYKEYTFADLLVLLQFDPNTLLKLINSSISKGEIQFKDVSKKYKTNK